MPSLRARLPAQADHIDDKGDIIKAGTDDPVDSVPDPMASEQGATTEVSQEQSTRSTIKDVLPRHDPAQKLDPSTHQTLVDALITSFGNEQIHNFIQDLGLDLRKRNLLESISRRAAANTLVKRAQEAGKLIEMVNLCTALKPKFAETYPEYASGSLPSDLNKLSEQIAQYFSSDELDALLHDLNLDHENFEARRQALARELVNTLDREGHIPVLVNRCAQLRPKVQWPTVSGHMSVQVPWQRASVQIREVLINSFNRSELNTLISDLKISDAGFDDERKSTLALELVLQVEREGAKQQQELITRIQRENPAAFRYLNPPMTFQSVLEQWQQEIRMHSTNNLQGISGRLRDQIAKRFDINGIDSLAQGLGVNPIEFENRTKIALARQLVAYCQKKNKLLELCKQCQTRRNDFDCSDGLNLA